MKKLEHARPIEQDYGYKCAGSGEVYLGQKVRLYGQEETVVGFKVDGKAVAVAITYSDVELGDTSSKLRSSACTVMLRGAGLKEFDYFDVGLIRNGKVNA